MNESRLEKRLRYAFECSQVVWKKPVKGRFAQVTADSGKKVIWLPPGYDQFYTLQTLIHELCHVAIPGELGAFGSFEEDIIMRVIEPAMMNWLTEHPRSQAWWLKKLRESKGGEVA